LFALFWLSLFTQHKQSLTFSNYPKDNQKRRSNLERPIREQICRMDALLTAKKSGNQMEIEIARTNLEEHDKYLSPESRQEGEEQSKV